MPVTEKTLRPMDRLNLVFAVSSGLLLASILWFAVVDYDQQWRESQNAYMDAQAVFARLDYLFTQRESERNKLRDAQTKVDESAQTVRESASVIDQKQAEINKLMAENADVKQRYSAADNVHQVTLQRYEHTRAELGPDHDRTRELQRQRDEESAKIAELLRVKQQHEDAITSLEKEIKSIRAPEVEARKAVADLEAKERDAKDKAEWYGGWYRRTLLNAPMMDFAAPKNTPGRHEIKQLVLPEVRQELNYLQSYTTDRCVTCHIAIDNRDFTMEALTARLERGIPSINEHLASLGRPTLSLPEPPVLEGEDAPKLKFGEVADAWRRLNRAQQSTYFDALVAAVNKYLADEGLTQLKLSKAVLAHPDLDLFVNVDSPHPMKTMGCTVCHEGNPQETTFVLAAHTPGGHKQEKEWEEEYYVRNAGVPIATFELMDHYWDRHMLPTQYTEGTCVKCHTEPSGIPTFAGEPQAEKLKLGYDLFTRVGCVNCHLVKGLENAPRVAPSLAHIESKLDRGFAEQWIYNPRAFRPSTWMPHFFMQENNGPGSESEWDPDPVLRNRVEVSAMVQYLYAVSQPWTGMETLPADLKGDAEKGRDLFKKVGCLGCHANLKEFGEPWIVRDRREHGETPEQAKANFDAMNTAARARYALDHFASDRDTVYNPSAVRFDPRKPYNVPIFTRVGPELSSIGSKTSLEWLYAWVRNPSSYHPDTRMPSLRLTPQEALDIATYLSGLKLDPAKDDFKPEPFPMDDKAVAMTDKIVFGMISAQQSEARTRQIMNDEGGELTRMLTGFVGSSDAAASFKAKVEQMSVQQKRLLYLGNKAVSHYGCYACHVVSGFETAVRPGTELTVWSQKPLSQLDFAFFDPAFAKAREEERNQERFSHLYPPTRPDLIEWHRGTNPPENITHDHAAFAYHKVLNPRIWDRDKTKKPYDKLKMPNFYFTPQEAEALVTFLMGRRSPRVSSDLVVNYENDPRDRIAAGRDLTRWFNCVGCHPIDDNVPTIQQYFRVKEGGKERFDEVNAPPALRGEGAKVQSGWFFGFINSVEMLRPWLEVRMPSFRMSSDQTRTIVEHFAGLSNEEAVQLDRRLKPIDDFRAAARATTAPASGAAAVADPAPRSGDDWFAQKNLKKQAEFVGDYAIHNRLAVPFQLDPSQNKPEELSQNFGQVHNDVSFLRDLYHAKYPFDDVIVDKVAEDRFKAGEEMILTLGCLSCHVLGDPTKEGANSKPSAPNLNLAYRRLRQDWVQHWVRAPAVIQPGTKMPQLWPNMQSAFASFKNRDELEAKFGKTADEQISLLVDYLYAAGLRNHTAIDPNLAKAKPTGGDSEEFIEDKPEEEFIEEP